LVDCVRAFKFLLELFSGADTVHSCPLQWALL
jgi:hypothetical protein